jgi:hypothetical protein
MISTLLQKAVSVVPWRMRGAIKHIPLVAPFQRWLVANFLSREEFVHRVDAGPARGLLYSVRLPQDKGVWTGTYETGFASAGASAVSPGDVCFDIGGWHGFYSGVMALAGATKVVVFEPLPANCARIRRLIDLNPESFSSCAAPPNSSKNISPFFFSKSIPPSWRENAGIFSKRSAMKSKC